MAMGADYTFELISIKTCAPQFKWLNKSFLGSVHNFKAQKINEVVNLSFLAMFTDTRNHLNTIKKHKHLEIKENNLQIIIHWYAKSFKENLVNYTSYLSDCFAISYNSLKKT